MKKIRRANQSNNHRDEPTVDEATKRFEKAEFKRRLSLLWADKRSFKVRLFLSIFASFAFVFTFFVFGPIELYISNMKYLTFSFDYLIMPIVLSALCVFAVILGILLLLRGKIFNCVLSSVFAATLCGYIQGNFLNIDHGSLDGHAIEWAALTLPTVLNFLIWVAIFAAVYLLLYLSKRFWGTAIKAVCILLIGVQAVAMITLIFNSRYSFTSISDEGYLSNKGIYEVSPKKNVIFFLLDRFDLDYAREQFERDDKLVENFKGFTFYENFTGSYSRTFPSVNYILTGYKTDYSLPCDDYVKKAWSESTFLKDIRDAGNLSKIYSEPAYTFQSVEYVREEIDNIGDAVRVVDYEKMLKYMFTLSAYRYAPEAFKPSFWFYTGDLASIATLQDNSSAIHTTDDYLFYKGVREEGISIDSDSEGSFIFYHMQGSHDPFTMDENGNRFSPAGWFDGIYQQTKGNLNMIFNYIEQLKELGVYDDTTIIISADHGWTGTMEELEKPRLLSLFIKPAGADINAPMQHSKKQICQDNLRASIISYFGLDTENYGRTIESIGENEEMVRYFWMSGSNPTKTRRDINLVTYEIRGDASDFSNWKIASKEPMKYPYYDAPN